MHNRKTGISGELLALEHLQQQGFQHLESNWRAGHCEIDLVMTDGDTVVFIEVKARKNNAYGWPEEAVKPAKKKNIIRAANAYLFEKKISSELRFDIVAITLFPLEVYHIRDAFSATDLSI